MIALSPSEFRYKMVIAVRTDLRMGRGKTAAQVAHAAVSALEEARKEHRDWVEAWLSEGQCKIAVKVHSEKELQELKEQAVSLCLPSVLICDRGLTQVPANTTTCIGIGPCPAELVDRLTRQLKLF